MSDLDAEAYGYALLLTRRTLTQALAGAPIELLSRPAAVATGELTTLQACAVRSCSRERWWVWPRELPLPKLPEPSSLADLLYALVRHRAVTEELLMTATADDLAAVWHTLTRHAVTPKPISFATALLLARRGGVGDWRHRARSASRARSHVERARRDTRSRSRCSRAPTNLAGGRPIACGHHSDAAMRTKPRHCA